MDGGPPDRDPRPSVGHAPDDAGDDAARALEDLVARLVDAPAHEEVGEPGHTGDGGAGEPSVGKQREDTPA